jgi:hypothetical protein
VWTEPARWGIEFLAEPADKETARIDFRLAGFTINYGILHSSETLNNLQSQYASGFQLD